jgi:hypothetical protein
MAPSGNGGFLAQSSKRRVLPIGSWARRYSDPFAADDVTPANAKLMTSATRRRQRPLWTTLVNAAVFVALVVGSAYMTGFDRDPWHMATTFALGLSTSLVAGFWMQGRSTAATWSGTFALVVVLAILMAVAARLRGQAPAGRIAFPNGTQAIPQFTLVAGTYEHVEDEGKLWVCLYTPGDRMHKYYCSNATKYPQGRWASDDSQGFQIGTDVAKNEALPYTLSLWLSDRSLLVGGEAFDGKPPAIKMDSVVVHRQK